MLCYTYNGTYGLAFAFAEFQGTIVAGRREHRLCRVLPRVIVVELRTLEAAGVTDQEQIDRSWPPPRATTTLLLPASDTLSDGASKCFRGYRRRFSRS